MSHPVSHPNIVFIVLDDVGFGHLSCYGSEVPTPHMDALAAEGNQYLDFHTTAVCAPTRASLLTGRDHHHVGMGIVPEFNNGTPGCTGEVSLEAALISEFLPDSYTNIAVGKWHLATHEDTGPSGPFRHWPLGRGFDMFHGFHGGSTDQWFPDLCRGNERDMSPADGRHLSDTLVDSALEYVGRFDSGGGRRFFMNLAFGACHSPLQAPREWIDRFKGAFDEGWDVIRERVHRRQLEMGVIPPGTKLPPREPEVPAWESLSEEQRRLYARMQEVYAGFLAHTDHAVGRFIEGLRVQGILENTLIVLLSDNGASEEGGNDGRSELLWYDDIGARESVVDYADELGGPKHHNHYPRGWAMVGNTPARRFKRNVYGGGVRDPLIIRWPASVGATPGMRRQYHHVVDIVPSVMELMGLELPAVVNGHPQMPMDGESLLYTATQSEAPTRKRVQIYEMWGNRAIWCNGWKAVAEHERGTSFDDDIWELFHTDEDFSESVNLAGEHPELLASLQRLWESEARRLNALPLDDRIHGRRLSGLFARRAELPETMEYGPRAQVPALLGPGVPTLPVSVEVELADMQHSAEGVLCSLGGRFGGWSLFLHDSRLHFDYVYYTYESKRVVSEPLELDGAHVLGFRFTPAPGDALSGTLAVTVDGETRASEDIDVVPLIHSSLEPFEVGQDTLAAVSDLYQSPNPLTGGRILKVRAGTRSAIRTDWEPQAKALVSAQ